MTNETERFQPSSVTLNWTSTYGSFIFHHGEIRFSHPIFVSSNWTQRIRSLVNFITYFEPPYLLDYNYIVVPLPTGFFVNAYFNGEGVQEFFTLVSCIWLLEQIILPISFKKWVRPKPQTYNHNYHLWHFTKVHTLQHFVICLVLLSPWPPISFALNKNHQNNKISY
jgi:hypothetical protein